MGHDCCARKSAVDGAEAVVGVTVMFPFLSDRSGMGPVVDEKLPWCCESDSCPPPLRQTTVAVYVASNSSVALMCPTPASVYPVQLTVVPVTEQLAVPDL